MELATDNREYKLKAFGMSIVIYAAFLAALFFFKIIYEPREEPIAMGVDLNYGIDLTGYGEIQTLNKANASKNNYDVKPADNSTVTQQQKAVSTPPPSTQTTKSTKTSTEKTPDVLTSSAEKSPVVMKKTPTTSTAPKTTSTSPAKTTNTTPPTPSRSVDQGSVMKKAGSGSKSNGTVGTRDGIGGNNNGNGSPGAVGDQGDPRGTPDGKSLMGNPGSGGSGGASVSISGWNKKDFNLPKDNTSETGRIVFNVTVDNRGNVISIVTKSSTVSPSVTNFYRSYIQSNLGKNLTPQGTPPPKSTGTITINITN